MLSYRDAGISALFAREASREGSRLTTGAAADSVDRENRGIHPAAGIGSAVTDLIFSIAKREVTFFSGTALISFL